MAGSEGEASAGTWQATREGVLREELAGLLDPEGGAPDAGDVLDVLWIARLGGLSPVDWSALEGGASPAAEPPSTDLRPRSGADVPSGPDDGSPLALLHLPGESDGSTPVRSGGAYAVRVARPQALPGTLALSRALRPLRQTVPSVSARTLDVAATAAASGDTGLLLPVLCPASERRFSIDLLVDTGASMTVWHRLADELRVLLARHGAFRDVRAWALGTDGPEPTLAPFRRAAGAVSPAARWWRPLADATGRRAVLVLTDGVGPAWYGEELPARLADWSARRPVAALQVLPSRLWHRTALRTVPVRARCTEAGRGTVEVRSSGPLPGIARGRAGAADRASIHWLPTLEVAGDWLAPWARLVSGRTTDWTPLRAAPLTVARRPSPMDPADEPSAPAGWIERFEEGYSPEAFRLLRLLAAAPLSLPVMNLVQRTMLPASTPMHLAEVFLSGVLIRRTPAEPGEDPDSVLYDFRDGVRGALLDRLTRTESLRVLGQVVECVSERVAETFGGVTDFGALVAAVGEREGRLDGLELPEGSQAFAEVALAVLGGIGGDYAEVAARLGPAGARGHSAMATLKGARGRRRERLRRWLEAFSSVQTPAKEETLERIASVTARVLGARSRGHEAEPAAGPVEADVVESGAAERDVVEADVVEPRVRVPHLIPPPPSPHIPRDGTSRIVEALRRGAPGRSAGHPHTIRSSCVIEGLPGVGKSVLAADCARQLASQFTMVRWIRAYSVAVLREDLTALADDIRLSSPADLGRHLRDNPGWLLIYDGLTPETARTAFSAEADHSWQPPEGCGSVLVTRSEPTPWPGEAFFEFVRLDGFSRGTALSYLEQALLPYQGRLWNEPVEVADLIDVEGTNPRELARLVSVLVAGRVPVDRHLQEEVARRTEVAAFVPSLVRILENGVFVGTGVAVGTDEVLTSAPVAPHRGRTEVRTQDGLDLKVRACAQWSGEPDVVLLELDEPAVLSSYVTVSDGTAVVAAWFTDGSESARLRALHGMPRPLPLGAALVDGLGQLQSLIVASASGSTAVPVARALADGEFSRRVPTPAGTGRYGSRTRPVMPADPRRLLVWPAPDVTTQQALSDRGYRPVIVQSREEVDAQIATFPAALFVDPLRGPITRTALQSLRQAAVASEVPIMVTAGLGQASREAAYGADPAVLLKALAPRDTEQHPPRVLLIEEHAEIALALTATLERRGMQVARTDSEVNVGGLVQRLRPNLVVANLMQMDLERAGIVDELRLNGRLYQTPLVVYTADIDPADLPRLASGETVLFLAERLTSAEVQSRVVDVLARIGPV